MRPITAISHEDSYVGIDVSKRNLDSHVLPGGRNWRVDHTPKGLASLAGELVSGLAPINRDSGSSRGRRYTHGGRNQFNPALYLAALSAARHQPTLKTFYNNLRQAGKGPKSALIAVARKLLVTLNSIARQTIQNA